MNYTYQITVKVPDGIDAGEPSLEMAEAIEVVANVHPDWHIGNFEVSAVDGETLLWARVPTS
jgi:hypothetical protein